MALGNHFASQNLIEPSTYKHPIIRITKQTSCKHPKYLKASETPAHMPGSTRGFSQA